MTRSALFLTGLMLAGFWLVSSDTLAQSSLGLGRGEQPLPTGGFFEGFFSWVRSQQAEFHQAIRGILLDMRNEGSHFWPLISICFLYGVFHAVGPGHGKVVVSSYMLANEVAARRGVIISMASALVQGITAIVAIGVFMVALRGTGIKTAELTFGLEAASYIGVMAVGVWLLWRKVFRNSHAHHDHDHGHNHGHDHHHHDHGHHHHRHDHHHHNHNHDHLHGVGTIQIQGGATASLGAAVVACDHCGHAHAPDPSTLQGAFGLREAWTAVLAVGLRPCTGALIVLIFCFANGLYLAGVVSTIAMSIGTGLSVSAMAILAVVAKNAAVRLANLQDNLGFVHRTIEITGAAIVFLIGLILFTALLYS
ncbi:MAG: nickel/cobalt transporter [Pseudomonadota bacterium]